MDKIQASKTAATTEKPTAIPPLQTKTAADTAATPKPDSTQASTGWQLRLNDATPFDPLLASLITLAKLHNISTSQDALLSGLPLENNRLTPELFKRAASRLGLSARIIRCSLSTIDQFGSFPLVLLLKHTQAWVLVKIDHPAKTAEVIQPESGSGFSKISLTELAESYSGFAIFVKQQYRFDAETTKANQQVTKKHWFWQAMAKAIPFYSNVLIASLLINIFSLASPLFIMNVYDRVVPNAAMSTLWMLALGVAIVFIFDIVLRNLRAFFIDLVGRGVDTEISRDTFEHLLGIKLEAAPSSASSLVSAVHNFEFFREFITSASIGLMVDIPFSLLFIGVMAFLGGEIAMVPLLSIPLILFLSYGTQSSLKDLVEESKLYGAEKHKILTESLGNIETLKALCIEGVMQKKWEAITKHLAKINAKMRNLANLGINASGFVNQIGLVVMVIIGAYKIAASEITTGALIACVILVSRALAPVSQVAALLTRYQQAKNAMRDLEQAMNTPTERDEELSFLHRTTLTGDIEFKDVVFSYPKQPLATLHHISFHIAPHEKVGIIGPTGSGKSTLIRLMLKLYTATTGNILIDGIEIKQIDPSELRHRIGYVSQDPVLFHGTIRDNISMVAPYVDDALILSALKLSGLDSFVTKHPQGLDRIIAERGQNLSGGQKQAIAIARALLLDAPILIFDEPSNSMDDGAVIAFMSNIKNNLANKTIILITHQLPMLQLVNRLLVVNSGQIVLDGIKDEVLAKLQPQAVRTRAEASKT